MSEKNSKECTRKIGQKLVALCNADKGMEALEQLYDEKIVSIEAEASEGLPAVMEGLEAVRGKSNWWYDNHEVHSSSAAGPYCGPHEDQFGVQFKMDVTFKPTGERTQMVEIGLYTVGSEGTIVKEEFWYEAD